MRPLFRRLGTALGGLLLAMGALWGMAAGADKTAADLLPATVVGYLEIPQFGKNLDTILDHPFTAEVLQTPEYQRALETPEYERFDKAIKFFEQRLGMTWREATRALTQGGVTAGFDLPTQGVVTLAQAKDEVLAEKAHGAMLDLAREVARQQGQSDAIKEDEHQGTKIHTVGEGSQAVRGKWLISSNKKALVYAVLDNFAATSQSPTETLAADEQFKKVTAARRSSPAAWLYADLRVLRLTGALRNALGKKSDNPAAEILAGGILGAVPDAAYATASLDLDASRIKLTASLPCNPKAVAKSREFYLGPEAAGRAPPLLKPKGTLLALSSYRDFASLWRHAPDLFDDGINAKFAEAESNLTTFFAGRSFRDDILGKLEPGVQVVVARQEFPQEGITPAIKLPAAAAVFRMKAPAETQRIFKVTFQSAVGFLNVAGAQNGVDPLDLNSEKIGDALVVSSGYLPPKDDSKRGEAALHYNASPTVAFVGDRFILSSSRPLVVDLIELVGRGQEAASSANTVAELDGKVGLESLAENRGPLIAQNMLEKGHDRAAAENEIDRALKALRLIKGSSLALNVADAHLELSLDVALGDGK